MIVYIEQHVLMTKLRNKNQKNRFFVELELQIQKRLNIKVINH